MSGATRLDHLVERGRRQHLGRLLGRFDAFDESSRLKKPDLADVTDKDRVDIGVERLLFRPSEPAKGYLGKLVVKRPDFDQSF